jgi:NitT/TauT family transport system ATP-binding protein
MNSILEIENISKNYYSKDKETTALLDISMNIYPGEFLVIVGPSGCGKSTLLNIIGGIDKESSGVIRGNKDIRIGYMLQSDSLFPWLTILDNALLGLKIKNDLTKENINYVKKLLKTYGLSEFINSYPKELSGGMRQRVALIRTLAMKPDILLLDEPFSALDYQTRLKVCDDVYEIIKEENKTVIMITHDIGEACSLADRIVVLSERPGKIKKIFNIKWDKKGTPFQNRMNKEFSTYYDMVWKEIDGYE